MKFEEKRQLAITGTDEKGRGTAGLGNRTAKVSFTIPGETVDGTFVRRGKGEFIFELDGVVTPSPHRIAPRCKFAGKCGGCAWQHIDYAHQLELKRVALNADLAAAGLPPLPEIVPAPEQFFYRNRMDYCVGREGELGLKVAGRWKSYLDLTECHLLSPDSVRAMEVFRGYMKEFGLTPWDNVRHEGYTRYFVIREGKRTGKRMCIVVTAEGELPAKDELVRRLAPLATSIYHGVNPRITDLSIPDRLELLHGEEFLEERIDGKTFCISPASFFQTNTAMAERLLSTIRRLSTVGTVPKGTVPLLLDLYCGVGFLGISLADLATRVIGVEIDAAAIAIATDNARRNGVKNAEFTAATAESLTWERDRPDVVIIDPPRAGLHPKVIKTLLANAPKRIVYVSCNYRSFLREWESFKTGYRVAKMEALDLFPQTPHMEVVALLARI